MTKGYQIKSKPMPVYKTGYYPEFEGATIKTGEKCTGQIINENAIWFECITSYGAVFETTEMPCQRMGT